MGMNASLSVAMATYNGEAYLEEQLQSISDQTILPSEVVICDDQSSDKTAEIVANFARQAPFPVLFVVNERRLGFRRNFMKTASLCSGDLISFSDQDDVWERAKVSEVLRFFCDSDCMLAAHDFSVVFQGGTRPVLESYFKFLRDSGLSKAISIKGCTLTIRKTLIDQVGWPPEAIRDRWGHDNWVCLVAGFLECQGFIDRPLIRHRIHDANTSGALWGGRDRLRRVLRSFHCPPFTSRSNLDVFLSYFFHAGDEDAYRAAIEHCATAMSGGQLMRARSTYANRMEFLNFPDSPEYARRATRIRRALSFFFRGVYRNGDGLLGLVQDIYGNRHGEI